MLSAPLIVDIATAPLGDASDFMSDEDFYAPENYGEEAAAKFIAKAKAKALDSCALDPHLCRITGLGITGPVVTGETQVMTTNTYGDQGEALILREVAFYLDKGCWLVSFNGLKFDWPVLNARARYLGVDLNISLDRYKSRHLDLYALMTNHGQLKGHSLSWWVKRHRWTDLAKPLTGAEEAQVPVSGRWKELAASLRHDVTATYRLAKWCGVL